MSTATITPPFARIRNIARGLDQTAAGLPDAPTHKQHFAQLRKAHGRDGWAGMKAVAEGLALEYKARQAERQAAEDARLAELHAEMSAPRVPKDAAPMLFAPEEPPVKPPNLAVRLMRWVRGRFAQPQTA